jgi:hypothetical protein
MLPEFWQRCISLQETFLRNVGSNQKIHGARSQKTVSCIVIAVKTSNRTYVYQFDRQTLLTVLLV